MTQPALPTVETLENSESHGRFKVEPLPKGWGITIGNAMRRVLLSSLPGAAITWVKIEGIQHEFTPIPHTKEDAVDFQLNIKDIRIKALSQRGGRLFLDVERDGEVTADDITPSADFEIVNPQTHLATLDSKKAKLHVELNVEIGIGYAPAASANGLPAGVIPVDAVFSPIRKVDFAVEPTRPGEESSQERLILDVTTDGTIKPEEAVSQSAAILIDQISVFRQLTKGPEEVGGGKTLLRQLVPPDKYDTPLEQLNLSTRTYNSLRRAGISTLGELLERSQRGLPTLPGFGSKSQDEVKGIIENMGLLSFIEIKEPTETETTSDSKKEAVDETPNNR
ncbi:MAG: DNA-directed RNA polymerase subunit alpha [Chloroflexota bacterium]